jgi:hypothetical protein
MRTAATLALCAGLAGTAGAQALHEQRVDVRVTTDVSTGGFDEPAGTPIRQTSVHLRYRAAAWTAQAELPWLRVAGSREDAAAVVSGARAADQGMGDLRLNVSVPLRPASAQAPGLDLVLRVKSGHGHAVGGLDTGGPGGSVRLELLQPAGAWNVFGHAGWSRAGDLPGTQAGRQAWTGELGASRLLAPKLEAGAFVSLRQGTAMVAPLREATLYAALNHGDRRWLLHVSRSLAPDSASVAAGLTFRTSF